MASRGVNKAIIIGNLGQDPEIRYMPSGDAVANLRVATSEKWTDKQTGEAKEATEWHTVVFFGKIAEVCGQYLKKGSKIYVEGSLRTRKWQGQDGQDRYTTEIKGRDMQMLGDSPGGQSNRGQGRPAEGGLTPEQAPPPDDRWSGRQADVGRYSQQVQRKAPAQGAAVDDDFDDDIPF